MAMGIDNIGVPGLTFKEEIELTYRVKQSIGPRLHPLTRGTPQSRESALKLAQNTIPK